MIFLYLALTCNPCDQALARVTSAQTFREAKERAREEAVKLTAIQLDWLMCHRLYALNPQQELEWIALWRELKAAKK